MGIFGNIFEGIVVDLAEPIVDFVLVFTSWENTDRCLESWIRWNIKANSNSMGSDLHVSGSKIQFSFIERIKNFLSSSLDNFHGSLGSIIWLESREVPLREFTEINDAITVGIKILESGGKLFLV